MSDNVLRYVENDTKPDLSCVHSDEDTGDPIDITGYSFILKIDYGDENGGTLEKTATITDATSGEFEFTWDVGDLRPGRFNASIKMTDDGGGEETFANLIFEIEAEIE